MTEERYTEICDGIIELLQELSNSPKYEELDTSTMFFMQELQNRINGELFLFLRKGLEFNKYETKHFNFKVNQ